MRVYSGVLAALMVLWCATACSGGAQCSPALVALVVEQRLAQPQAGYHHCRAALLRQGHHPPAAATIGRIWVRAGLLERQTKRERRPTRWVPPRPQQPGHVQCDVKYLPGGRYEFTALDVYSRWAAAKVTAALNAAEAQRFLTELLASLPFAIQTVQVDGGGEFKAGFAAELERRGLALRRNAPHSPWQNGVVERFHRTVAEECYLGLQDELERLPLPQLNAALQAYLNHYNHSRLHSSLGYRPPAELLGTSSEPVYPRVPRRCPSIP